MADLRELQRIKERVDDLRDEVNRAKGALDQLMARLRDEWGCDSIEEAEGKLEDLRSREHELAEKFDRMLEEFKEKYGDLI